MITCHQVPLSVFSNITSCQSASMYLHWSHMMLIYKQRDLHCVHNYTDVVEVTWLIIQDQCYRLHIVSILTYLPITDVKNKRVWYFQQKPWNAGMTWHEVPRMHNLPRVEFMDNTFEANDCKQPRTKAGKPRKRKYEKCYQTFPSSTIWQRRTYISLRYTSIRHLDNITLFSTVSIYKLRHQLTCFGT